MGDFDQVVELCVSPIHSCSMMLNNERGTPYEQPCGKEGQMEMRLSKQPLPVPKLDCCEKRAATSSACLQ